MAEQEFKHIIRVANTDLDGNKHILQALRKIRGISFMVANAICEVTKTDKRMKAGNMQQETVEKLNDALKNPLKFRIPSWMLNRKKDPETGDNKHLIGADIKFTVDNDKKIMAMMKSYKGIRHQLGLPVRGQSTKSNFRRNKGKVQGVKRTKPAGKSSGK